MQLQLDRSSPVFLKDSHDRIDEGMLWLLYKFVTTVWLSFLRDEGIAYLVSLELNFAGYSSSGSFE
jgi:hypothetical protein